MSVATVFLAALLTALATGLGALPLLFGRTQHRHVHFGALRGAAALGAVMIVGVMTLDSFTEGIGVGVAFGDGAALGALIATAIAVHDIPEGLAISLVLVPRGISVMRAAAWSVFSSLPQPLMAVPAYLLVEWFGSTVDSRRARGAA
jgi:zinc transporter, ZIP family